MSAMTTVWVLLLAQMTVGVFAAILSVKWAHRYAPWRRWAALRHDDVPAGEPYPADPSGRYPEHV